MRFQATRVSATPKGKLKCFKCRLLVSVKEGAWQTKDSQQVFICAKCEASEAKPS